MRMQWNAASAAGGVALKRARAPTHATATSVRRYRIVGLQLRGEIGQARPEIAAPTIRRFRKLLDAPHDEVFRRADVSGRKRGVLRSSNDMLAPLPRSFFLVRMEAPVSRL